MPVVFAANRINDFEVVRNVETTTTAGRVPPDMADAMFFNDSGDQLHSRFKQSVTNYWVSFYYQATTPSTAGTFSLYFGDFSLFPTSGQFPISLHFGRTIIDLRINNADVGTFAMPAAEQTLARIDMRIRLAASGGLLEVYLDGVLIIQYEGNTAQTAPTHSAMSVYGAPINTSAIGAIIVATGDTRTYRLAAMPITGNGAIQEWTGTYTAITEASHDPSDFVESNTPNAETTYLFDVPPTPVGYQIGAVIISGQMSLYSEAVDSLSVIQYDGVGVTEMGVINEPLVVFAGKQIIAEINPATGVRYTDADLLNNEFGFKVELLP